MNLQGFRRGAIVVAHPDDESLFFAGVPIRFPGDWTIICCSIPRRDPIRQWQFFDACGVLGARGRVFPVQEPESCDGQMTSLSEIDLSGFDVIVTHNAAGEYGHAHHRQVHNHVAAHYGNRAFYSGYGSGISPSVSIALTDAEFARKLAALQCYRHTTPIDGKPKWQALLDRYGAQFDFRNETYARA